MTRRLGWDARKSVNRHAATDVIGVIHRSRRPVPADDFVINNEPAAGRVGYARLTVLDKRLVAARGNRKNSDATFVVDQQEHLTIYIYLDMLIPRFSGFRGGAGANCLELIERRLASNRAALPFLERDQCRPSRSIK